jgi:ribose transport system ATP-binding protein/rhamnose transport system ATP-binding protein
MLQPKVLILDEPTKGVDIGTRASIYTLLRDIAAKGVAVVVVSSDFEELLGLCDRIVVISDGLSIADLPASLLDEEKLTLLAAPRTSMARNTEMLKSLAGDVGGAGFWVLIDVDQLICLNMVIAERAADPGFAAGEARTFADTRIETALRRRDASFVPEQDGDRSTMLVPLTSSRGHDLGWVGLTLPGTAPIPSPDMVRRRVEALATTL